MRTCQRPDLEERLAIQESAASVAEHGPVGLDVAGVDPTALLVAPELEVLGQLGAAHEIILDLVAEAEPAYRWKQKQQRIKDAADLLSQRFQLADTAAIHNELLSLSMKKLSLDNRRTQALERGVSTPEANLEWEEGWRALHFWMEGRLVVAQICGQEQARELAFAALVACKQFSN